MRNKLKILIIAGVIILLVIIFVIISLFGKGPVTPRDQTALPTPASEFIEGELYITSIKPLDSTQTYSPAQPVEITFTQTLDKLALRYEVTPTTETFVVNSPNPQSLIIVPTTMWSNGATTITILENSTSTEGKTLKNPQSYILNTAIPTIPDLEGAY